MIPNPMMVIGLDFTVIASRDYGYSQLQDRRAGRHRGTQALINSLKYDENYTEAVNYTGYFLYPGNQLVPLPVRQYQPFRDAGLPFPTFFQGNAAG